MTNRMEKLAKEYCKYWNTKFPEKQVSYDNMDDKHQKAMQDCMYHITEYNEILKDEVDTSFIDENIEVYKRLADR